MSNPKNRAPVARRAAAALALLAAAAAVPQANAAVTRTHFQQEVMLSSCSSTACYANFIDLPANQALQIDHVWCQIQTGGTVFSALLLYTPAPPSFTVPLDLLWQRTVTGGNKLVTLGMQTNMRVPGGGFIQGDCSVTGERLIQS